MSIGGKGWRKATEWNLSVSPKLVQSPGELSTIVDNNCEYKRARVVCCLLPVTPRSCHEHTKGRQAESGRIEKASAWVWCRKGNAVVSTAGACSSLRMLQHQLEPTMRLTPVIFSWFIYFWIRATVGRLCSSVPGFLIPTLRFFSRAALVSSFLESDSCIFTWYRPIFPHPNNTYYGWFWFSSWIESLHPLQCSWYTFT